MYCNDPVSSYSPSINKMGMLICSETGIDVETLFHWAMSFPSWLQQCFKLYLSSIWWTWKVWFSDETISATTSNLQDHWIMNCNDISMHWISMEGWGLLTGDSIGCETTLRIKCLLSQEIRIKRFSWNCSTVFVF